MSDENDKKGRAERPTSNVFTRLPQKVMQEMKEKKAKAATSSVLTKFSQSQIQEMKEAFTMIDQDRDGLINVNDLKEMYSNLGLCPSDKTLQDMVKEAPGQLNFTMFLSLFSEKLSGVCPADTVLEKMVKEIPSGQVNFTAFLSMFSDKLSGTDPEDTLRNAFAMFDAEHTGFIPEEYMKDLLQNMGDNFTQDEIRQTWKEAPFSAGKLDYNAFVSKIKGKEQDD